MLKLFRYYLFILVITGSFVSGCATVPLTHRNQVSLVSNKELIQSSFQSYNELIGKSSISKSRRDNIVLERVSKRLTKAVEELMKEYNRSDELSYFDWEYNLIEDDDVVNAFCMPGGKIVVYTGILPIAETETGLAVVIGHEIAHAIAHHGNERLSQMILADLGAKTLAAAVSKNSVRTRNLFLLAFGVGSQLGVILPYSRLHEYEADRLGLTIMAKAGYDPREAVEFWKRMQAQQDQKMVEFLSTHPSSEKRIENMRTYLPEAMKYYKN